MPHPLYDLEDRGCYQSTTQTGHKGLLYDRFFDKYQLPDCIIPEPRRDDQIAPRVEWINNISSLCGNKKSLRSATYRQIKLAAQLHGESRCFKTDWHFITGMGNRHPIENGFSWHPTLGTPYLSGASVKGLVRNWLESWCATDNDTLLRWFGSVKKDQAEQAGAFIFFDAIPVEPPTLSADIMTPHMGNWYAEGNKIENIADNSDKVPADWHAPNPISFLVVRKASFIFSIAPRKQYKATYEKATEELPKIMDALSKALDYLGGGAKTNAGYGRMTPDTHHNKKILKDAREAKNSTLTTEDRMLEEITQQLDGDPNKAFICSGNAAFQKIEETLNLALNWDKTKRNKAAKIAERFFVEHVGWGKKKKQIDKRQALVEKLKAD